MEYLLFEMTVFVPKEVVLTIELSLLRSTIAVRIQSLVSNIFILTSRLLLYRVSLWRSYCTFTARMGISSLVLASNILL